MNTSKGFTGLQVAGLLAAGLACGCSGAQGFDDQSSSADVSQGLVLSSGEADGDAESKKFDGDTDLGLIAAYSGDTACGGSVGDACPPGQYCTFRGPTDACGWADAIGRCQDVPTACTLEFQPVCGCDGMTYSNACWAAHNAVGVLDTKPCGGEPFDVLKDPPPDDGRTPHAGAGSFGANVHPQAAVLDYNCAGETYRVSTGTIGGDCTTSTVGLSCEDGANGASLNCQDYPNNPCIQSTGSGSCTCTTCD